MDILPRRKPSKKASFSLDDYDAMARLLEQGYDLQIALNVIASLRNQSRIQLLHKQLAAGIPLCNHLIDIKGLDVHFQFFYHHVSLAEALQQSLGMYRYEQKTKQHLLASASYPLVVMAVSITGFLFMMLIILPLMMNLLASMDLHLDAMLVAFIRGLSIVVVALIAGLILSSILLTIQLREENQVPFFLWLNRYCSSHLLMFFHSYFWAGYWQQFTLQACSTVDTLEFLNKMTYRPLVAYCAKNIDASLREGIPLVAAMKETKMFSERLLFYFEVGIMCHQLDQFLMTYQEESRQTIDRYVKRWIVMMQTGTYVFVGLMVVMMAQVLFAPLELLSTLG